MTFFFQISEHQISEFFSNMSVYLAVKNRFIVNSKSYNAM